jgi:hypothetical protein
MKSNFQTSNPLPFFFRELVICYRSFCALFDVAALLEIGHLLLCFPLLW